MLSAIFNSLKFPRRRPTASRRDARSRRPLMESMEGRQLLTTFMMIENSMVTEGTGGTTPMKFTVSLLMPTSEPVTVDYQTVDGGARAGEDYNPTRGSLTFAPGELSKTVTVDAIGDGAYEVNESFYVSLTNASGNCWVIQPTGLGTIIDDDAPKVAEFSIGDATLVRGWGGAVRSMDFTVSLAAPASQTVSVRASTYGMTAWAGHDFENTSRVLTFAPGETTKTFSVQVYGSSTDVWDELLWVGLSESSLAVKRGWAFGTLKFGG